MLIPPGDGHCAGGEVSEIQLPGRLENHPRQHFEGSLEEQEWWELCIAKILGMGQKEGKGWVQDDSCKETQSEASAPPCLLHSMAVSSCTSGAGECHAGSGTAVLCSWGVVHSLKWFGKAADAVSSILSAGTGTLPSRARCAGWHPTIRAHILLWIGASCEGSPRRGTPCFRVGHHVT